MSRQTLVITLGLLLISTITAQSNELVRAGSLNPIPIIELGSAITVLTREQIEMHQVPFATDLLRHVPGVSVSRAGTFGSTTQARIRGAEGNHTLVLIDGVEVNDPALNDEYDLGLLLAGDIDRIEVLRGPQSAIYGSETIGGVINVITRETPPGIHTIIDAEIGSFGTYRTHLLLGGGTELWRLTGSANYLSTDGFSLSPQGGERDGYENTTFNLNGFAKPSIDVTIGGSLRYTHANRENDEQDFRFPARVTQGLIINSNDELNENQMYGRAYLEVNLLNDRWTHLVEAITTRTSREFERNRARDNIIHGMKRRYRYQSSINFDWLSAKHILTAAYEWESNQLDNNPSSPTNLAHQRKTIRQNSWTGEYRYSWRNSVFLSGSARHDKNEQFANSTAYRLTGSWVLPWRSTLLRTSFGKGIQNPGLFELAGYIPNYFSPNPSLNPEESIGWDIGIEHEIFSGVASFGITYFQSDLSNEIVTIFDQNTYLSSAGNLDGKSDRRGIEATISLAPMEGLNLGINYTFTRSEQADRQREVRRPGHMASATIGYSFFRERARLNASFAYNGRMEDTEFIFSTPEDKITLDDYTLVNVTGSIQFTDTITMFARLENIFNKNYQEIFGYESPGIGAYMGFRIRLSN